MPRLNAFWGRAGGHGCLGKSFETRL
jgi:hypothetical protein